MDPSAHARRTARSFALSLKLLPRELRGELTLAYLLARATDSVADAPGIDPSARLGHLDALAEAVAAGDGVPPLPEAVRSGLPAEETRLLDDLPEILAALGREGNDVHARVSGLMKTIISGQRLDITRFEVDGMRALVDEDQLADYTYRVAGCVGRYWTDVLAARLPRALQVSAEELAAMGETYGRGLQLLNILRDAPADWRDGRCYLPGGPVPDGPGKEPPRALFEQVRSRLAACRDLVGHGEAYGRRLRGRRVRAASVLPARLGLMTLDLLDAASEAAWRAGVKVSRGRVKTEVLKALVRG